MKKMSLITLVLFTLNLSASALASNKPAAYTATECNAAGQTEDYNDSVTDFILAQNTFENGSNHSLQTAVRLTDDPSSRYSAQGAALLAIDKDDTVIEGMYVCNKSVAAGDKSNFSQSRFSFDTALSLNEMLKAKNKTYNLEQGVYMGDEHIATKGSKLVSEVVQTKDGVYSLKMTLTLNVADLTEAGDSADEDNLPAHEVLKATIYLSLPQMTLKTK